MHRKMLKRGFTLIELLVVIAIIGILASVVLASLNTARDKGADASAKASLNNMRAQMELFYDDQSPNSYDTGCTADATVAAALTAAGDAVGGTADCDDDDDEWAAEILLTDGSTYYCVDSTGVAQESSSSKGGSAVSC